LEASEDLALVMEQNGTKRGRKRQRRDEGSDLEVTIPNGSRSEMFSTIGAEIINLEQSIAKFNLFLRNHELYPYLNGFLQQFSDLSHQMRTRMRELQVLYSFLSGHHMSASKTSAGYFSVLPHELCLYILSFLDWHDLCNMGLLNRQWQSLSRDDMLWKALCAKRWKEMWNSSTRVPLCSSPDLSSISALSLASTSEEESGEESGGRASEPKKKKVRTTHTAETRPRWQDVFKGRLLVDRNWRLGNCSVRSLSPQSQVESAAFCLHFDDERFITATDSIEVFNVNTGELIRTLRGHTDSVMCLDFNKQWIVSGSKDHTIRVWDVKTGQVKHVLGGHANGVRTVRFDEKIIVSGSRDATIKVWGLEEGVPLRTMRGHAYTVYCLEFDNRYVISGSVDKTIRVWDVETTEQAATLKGHSNSIRCLKFDQSRLVSGAWDNHVKLWDLETSKCMTTYKGHTDRVMCLQFDHNKIVSGSVDKTVRIWDMRTTSPAIILKGHSSCAYDLHFDEFKIVSASKDRGLITWDFRAPQQRDRLTVATLDSDGCYVFDAALIPSSASTTSLNSSATPP
jgi:WD40 repeat protein